MNANVQNPDFDGAKTETFAEGRIEALGEERS